MEKYARLTEEDIIRIANLMATCRTATELSAETHFDVSGLIKHIKKYRTLSETSSANKCGRKKGCGHAGDLCRDCRRKKYGQQSPACPSCKRDCNQFCPGFTKIPECPKLLKFPYVCNFCESLKWCHLSHFYYEPSSV